MRVSHNLYRYDGQIFSKLNILVRKLNKIVVCEDFLVIFALANTKNSTTMQKLTNREEELMQIFWLQGPMFVKDIVALYDDPKPHFNTISTMVRTLESKGFLDHEAFGNTYRYRPIISQEEFSKGVLGSVVTRYFENSYQSVVSALIAEEKISVDELEELIRKVQNQ